MFCVIPTILLLCSKYWDQRNKFIFQNKIPCVREVAIHITKFLRYFWDVTKLVIRKHKEQNYELYWLATSPC